ncbi:MAG TPA: sterol desaturase family protein [Xanthomonadaceae bacterium]|jgi:sterol desaturase/sphingolipid hydroxylase (fatty acid hydroxylase superfamily)|nr:sterol desaturase family protein [Xanthomonadaceae bacterium]
MSATVLSLVVGFVALLTGFRLIERLRPKHQRMRILRRGFWTDLAYWACTPLTARLLTPVTVVVVLAPLALLIYGRIDRDLILHGYGPVSRKPLWVQGIGIVLVAEIVGYWMHRAFHSTWLWKFHAVHHSSVELDWLSAVRVHPFDDAIAKLAATAPILVLGFAPIAVAGIIPVLTLLAILVHAHVDWDWGPFRGVIASPCFHRWHHTDEAAARDMNFAGLLPVLDILFGTYHMPKGMRPASFGTQTPVPDGLLGQLAFPFTRRGRVS